YSLVSLFFAFSYFFFFVLIPLPQLSPLFPYTTLFRSPNLSFSSSVLVPYTLSPMRVRIMIPITGFGTTCWYFTETRTTASSPLRQTAVGLPFSPRVSTHRISARPSPLRRRGASGLWTVSPHSRTRVEIRER